MVTAIPRRAWWEGKREKKLEPKKNGRQFLTKTTTENFPTKNPPGRTAIFGDGSFARKNIGAVPVLPFPSGGSLWVRLMFLSILEGVSGP